MIFNENVLFLIANHWYSVYSGEAEGMVGDSTGDRTGEAGAMDSTGDWTGEAGAAGSI
jgi:hypothetical protein